MIHDWIVFHLIRRKELQRVVEKEKNVKAERKCEKEISKESTVSGKVTLLRETRTPVQHTP